MAEEFDYSQFKEGPGDNLLARLSEAAVRQKQAEKAVADLEEELRKAKAAFVHISEHEIPALMDEAEMTEFVTKDNLRVKIREKIRGSIPAASKAKAFRWLEDHNFDKLIKRQFKVEFGRDEEEWAKEFEQELAQREKPLKFVVDRSIHPATLSSFISEQLESGEDIPLDLFGAYRQRSAKVEAPK